MIIRREGGQQLWNNGEDFSAPFCVLLAAPFAEKGCALQG